MELYDNRDEHPARSRRETLGTFHVKRLDPEDDARPWLARKEGPALFPWRRLRLG